MVGEALLNKTPPYNNSLTMLWLRSNHLQHKIMGKDKFLYNYETELKVEENTSQPNNRRTYLLKTGKRQSKVTQLHMEISALDGDNSSLSSEA